MKEIPLTQGKVALVDDTDYEELNQYKWHACNWRGDFYAMRHPPRVNGKQSTIQMSRQVLGLECGDRRQADHQNHNTLDNCQSNLRICTQQENLMNGKPHSDSTSKFKGVSWHKQHNKWHARIYINGKTKHLGLWDMEEVAALRYDMVAIREFGEFAYLNFN